MLRTQKRSIFESVYLFMGVDICGINYQDG